MSTQNQATSYARVVRLKGDPNKVDEAIRLYTQEILPLIKKQKGFTGVTLLGNRKTGDALSVSYWETETSMKDARGQTRPEALKVLGKTGGSIVEDDECEVALLERFKPPMAGAWARVTTVHGDPAHASESVSNFTENIVPAIAKQSGARTAYFFVNRQSGLTYAGSIWDTEFDLQKSEASIGSLRAEAIKKFAGRDARTEAFEIYFTEILAPVASVR
jgi:heme-degrading monooxygenase HmoA